MPVITSNPRHSHSLRVAPSLPPTHPLPPLETLTVPSAACDPSAAKSAVWATASWRSPWRPGLMGPCIFPEDTVSCKDLLSDSCSPTALRECCPWWCPLLPGLPPISSPSFSPKSPNSEPQAVGIFQPPFISPFFVDFCSRLIIMISNVTLALIVRIPVSRDMILSIHDS